MKFQLAINLERLDDGDDMRDVAAHTLEMVQMADRGGFHIVWAAEHHAIEMTIAPDPFQLLAWWGANTSDIRLGTAVVNAAYWHPIKLAGEAAMADLISGGRLEFGIGSGAYQREFDRMHPGLKQVIAGVTCTRCCRRSKRCGRAITNIMANSGPFPCRPRCRNRCNSHTADLGSGTRANHL